MSGSLYHSLEGASSTSHNGHILRRGAALLGLLLVACSGWAARRAMLFSASKESSSSSSSSFMPKQGLDHVLVRPGSPHLVLVARPTAHHGTTAVFLYTTRLRELASGHASQEAWLYGAKLLPVTNSPQHAQLASATGAAGDITQGVVVQWSADVLKGKLQELDQLLGYDPTHPQECVVRRAVNKVVLGDGSTMDALWYHRLLPAAPSEEDDRNAKKAATFRQTFLAKEDLLHLSWPVKITMSRYEPGFVPKQRDQKVLHIMRHGQGFHNLLNQVYREQGIKGLDSAFRPELLDTPLTAIGRDQAKGMRTHIAALGGLELVVTSPMARAVQTALLAFQPLTSDCKVPIVAHQYITEQSGLKQCNKRRNMDEIKQDFPTVDFSDPSLGGQVDPLWKPETQESARAMSQRGYEFLLWLRHRPEKEIAMVTHCQFVYTLLNTVVKTQDSSLQAWFNVGSLRSIVLDYQ